MNPQCEQFSTCEYTLTFRNGLDDTFDKDYEINVLTKCMEKDKTTPCPKH